MWDDVPVQFWLLIVIAAMGLGPVRYIWRYLGHSPQRRDITQPPEDLRWRTVRALIINLAVLVALVIVAIFIFTPVAARFAQSAIFWPLIIRAFGGLALSTVWRGARSGRVQPLVRGTSATFDRTAQPRRFWASMAWNLSVGALAIWASFAFFPERSASTPEVQCRFEREQRRTSEVIEACTYAISEARAGKQSPEKLLSARAAAYLAAGNWPAALNDLDEVVILSRGSFDARLGRGVTYLLAGMPEAAVPDLTAAHQMRRHDPRPVASRAIAYADLRDAVRARRDVAILLELSPHDPAAFNVEARLSLRAGDMKAAIRALDALLQQDPKNEWARMQRRAAYARLGRTAAMKEGDDARLRIAMDRPPSNAG